MQAELTGVRAQLGLASAEDFTSKERFLQLEQEREAFEKFFGSAWKKTKRRMLKEALSKKPERPKKNKKPVEEAIPEPPAEEEVVQNEFINDEQPEQDYAENAPIEENEPVFDEPENEEETDQVAERNEFEMGEGE